MFPKPRLCSIGEDGEALRSGFMGGNPGCSTEDCILDQARRILTTGSILPEGIIETIISGLKFLKFCAIFLGATTAKWILTLALQTLSTFAHIAAWKIRAISNLFDLLLGINNALLG